MPESENQNLGVSTDQGQPTINAKVAVVGGGVTGSAVVANALDHYTEMLKNDPDLPPLELDWFDGTNRFGVGSPYFLNSLVFRLNQPAFRMSTRVDRPGDFVEWLEERERRKNIRDVAAARKEMQRLKSLGMSDNQIAYQQPKIFDLATHYNQYSFVPRAIYGQYSQERSHADLDEAIDRINSQLDRKAVSINHHVWQVSHMEPGTGENTINVLAKDAAASDSSHIVSAYAAALATGHQKNDIFAKFEGNPNYRATPLNDVGDIASLVDKDLNPAEPLFILGTSQSMLDALGALDAIGYKGKIIAASTNGVEPWPFDPEKHLGEEDFSYSLKYVTPENIERLKGLYSGDEKKITSAIYKLVGKELQDPDAVSFGVRRVLNKLTLTNGDFCKEFRKTNPELYSILQKVGEECSGNSTFPERYETFRKYKESGQLQIMSARVNVNMTKAREDGKGFYIQLENPVDGTSERLSVAKMINCAAFARNPYTVDRETGYVRANDPVTQDALDMGLVSVDKEKKELHANPQSTGALVEPVGPTSTSGWGVPYTKASFDAVARNVVVRAVKEAQKDKVARVPAPGVPRSPV